MIAGLITTAESVVRSTDLPANAALWLEHIALCFATALLQGDSRASYPFFVFCGFCLGIVALIYGRSGAVSTSMSRYGEQSLYLGKQEVMSVPFKGKGMMAEKFCK